MAKGSKQDEMQAIIIKKVIKKGGGHHGGAWKVAYADFVTAMMAFFLLLWLLNVSTDEALEVISSYFDPSHPRIADTRSGAGGLMGGLTMSKEGAMAEDRQPPVSQQNTGTDRKTMEVDKQGGVPPDTLEKLEDSLRKKEEERFKEAQDALEKAMQSNEDLKALAKHLKIDVTPEGLRIQIIDQEGKPMFASGSAKMLPKTKTLMEAVANVIQSMPNNISVRGHTDSHKYASGASYTNWELSADRANAARRVLMNKNIPVSRLHDVTGKADREHLITDNPLDARNRRISVILLRETVENAFERGAFDDELPAGEDFDDFDDFKDYNDNLPLIDDKPVGTFQKSPGNVYFP